MGNTPPEELYLQEGSLMKENALQGIMDTLGLRWFDDNQQRINQEQEGMLTQIEDARREWLSARTYFNSVLDPDLVEHAVYVNQAAEKRYMYLLKQAKEQNIRSNHPLRVE